MRAPEIRLIAFVFNGARRIFNSPTELPLKLTLKPEGGTSVLINLSHRADLLEPSTAGLECLVLFHTQAVMFSENEEWNVGGDH